MKRKYFVLLAILSAVFLIGCDSSNSKDIAENGLKNKETSAVYDQEKQNAESDSNISEKDLININVTSESLTPDGKWLTVINSSSASPAGLNMSPQLSWDEVEGVACYAIYMVDKSAGHWLHWRAKSVKETSIPLGAELEESSYIAHILPAVPMNMKLLYMP